MKIRSLASLVLATSGLAPAVANAACTAPEGTYVGQRSISVYTSSGKLSGVASELVTCTFAADGSGACAAKGKMVPTKSSNARYTYEFSVPARGTPTHTFSTSDCTGTVFVTVTSQTGGADMSNTTIAYGTSNSGEDFHYVDFSNSSKSPIATYSVLRRV